MKPLMFAVAAFCAAASLLGLASQGVAKPSFRCAGKLNATERRICANPVLGKLDRRMVDAFKSLRARLPAARKSELKRDQRKWLKTRNRCRSNDGCIEGRYLERIAALNEYESPGKPAAVDCGGGTGIFPLAALSWGGVVRSGPGLGHRKIASLGNRAPITLLEDTGVEMSGYVWFKIRFDGQVGYQWGGIVCPLGRAVQGAFQVCD